MEQEKDLQKHETKELAIGDLISIDVRSIEIPASEYRDMIATKTKADVLIRFFANGGDKYDGVDLFKTVFAEEIMKATTMLRMKEADE